MTPETGRCADCVHAREQRNDRGSTFLRCARSERDPAYPKYPRMPVVSCPGHEPTAPKPA